MRKLTVLFALALAPMFSWASSGSNHLLEAKIDLADRPSLQRGAKLFVNYCLSCHSASFMRYNRMGRDLGLTDEQVIHNLMFTADKIGEPMNVAMSASDAKDWFGTTPPDLSVIARARGTDWLYTYLMTFYRDESRPFGVNNMVFKDVGMPHVLWELQGWQKPVYKSEVGEDGKSRQVIDKLELVEPGELTPAEYDKAVTDLVNFLAYMGEPAKLERQRLGVWVLLFLALLFVVSYALKKEYWKDVH